MFAQALLNGIIQVIIFSLVPLIWWLITSSKRENFLSWLGIKKPIVKSKKKWILLLFQAFLSMGISKQEC